MHNFKKLTFAILALHFLLMFQSVSQADTITRSVTYRDRIGFDPIVEEWNGELEDPTSSVGVRFTVYIDPGSIDTEIHGRVILDLETEDVRIEPRWVRNEICDQFVGKFSTRGGVKIGGWLFIDIQIDPPFLDSELDVKHEIPLSALNVLLPVEVPENIDKSWDEAAYFDSLPDGENEEITLEPELQEVVSFELMGTKIFEFVLARLTWGASKAAEEALKKVPGNEQKGQLRKAIERILGNAGFKLYANLGSKLTLSDVKPDYKSTVASDKMIVDTWYDGKLSAQPFLAFNADFVWKLKPLGVELWTHDVKIDEKRYDLTLQHEVATLDMKGTPNPVEFPLNTDAEDFTQWDLPGGASARLGKGATLDMAYSPNGDLIAVGTSTGAWLYDAHTGAEVALLSAGSVVSMSFSSDGKTLATASTRYHAPELVRFWDVATRTEKPRAPEFYPAGSIVGFGRDDTILATIDRDKVYLWEVAAQPKKIRDVLNVRTVSLSPDGAILAIHYYGGFNASIVELIDVDTGERIAILTGHSGRIQSLSFSPDSRTLAAGNDRDTVYLWDVAAQTVKTALKGPTDTVDLASISFSPDGKTLASGGRDGKVRLWDLATGGQIAILTGHTSDVTRLSFGPDGKTLASFSIQDGTVNMWNVATKLRKFTISGYRTITQGPDTQGPDQNVIFSPDGKTLASIGSDDGAIHLWDVASGRQRAALNGCRGLGEHILSASFSPDGKTLASGGSDDMLRLWDVASGREITALKHDYHVSHVSFSPDGKTLASFDRGIGMRLWNVGAWTERTALSHPEGVESVSFSPDNRTLATTVRGDGEVHSYKDVYLWDIETGEQVGALTGHTKKVRSVSFSPSDGEFLASAGDDGALLWDVAARKIIATLTLERVWSVNFSPDRNSKMLASSGSDGTALWNVGDRAEIAVLYRDKDVYDLSFSPNGKKLAGVRSAGVRSGEILLWDVGTGTEIATIPGADEYVSRSVSFSPDSGTLASMGYDYATVHLWDVATGKEKIRLTRHTGGVSHGSTYGTASVSFSPVRDSKLLASGGLDGTVRLWDVETRTQIRALTGHTGAVRSVSFSPVRDSKMLASGEWDGTVRLWNAAKGEEIGALTGHTKSVLSVVFSPDGKRLASIDDDDELRLWDVEARTEIATLTGDNWWETRSASFSPVRDSKLLAGGGDDGMVRLWDVDTGAEIAVIPGPADGVTSVSFSPDGKTLAATGIAGWEKTGRLAYGLVYLWDVATRTEIAVIRVQGAKTRSVSFSPDSRTLAYVDPDAKTVRLWDIEARTEKPGFTTRIADTIYSASFSPDGKTLASSGHLEVRLWDVATRIPKVTIRISDADKAIFSPDGRTLVIPNGRDNDKLFWLRVPSSGAVADPPRLAADINGDGVVNVQDLVAVSAALGQTGNNAADVNGDGAVNIQDLVAVAAALAEAAAAPALSHAQHVEGLTAAEVGHWIALAQGADLADPESQRGLRFLHYLSAMLAPKETALLANYPNPFNPETWMPYRLAKPAEVALTIYAADGDVVRALALGHQPAGVYQAKSRAAYWDGRNSRGEPVASGVYFYTLNAGNFTATRKMLIRK